MRSLPYYLFLVVLLSCHQKAVEEEDGCNCKGKAAVIVTDVPAHISASVGRYLIFKEVVNHEGGAIKTVFLCDTLLIRNLPTSNNDDYDYLVSGNLRPPCAKRGIVYIWNLELTSIGKK